MGYRRNYDVLEEEDTGDNFLIRHWRGHLSLPTSWFLVGGALSAVALNIILLGVLAVQESSTSLQLIAAAWIGFMALFLVIRTWAIVGIWRSADRHEARGGSAGWASFAKFLLIVGVLGSFAQAKNYGLQALEYGQLALGKDPIGAMADIQRVGEKDIKLSGLITQGTADRLREAADKTPNLKTIHLESLGGRIFEAEQIAEYVRQRGLDTRVNKRCESACTVILIAGRERFAERVARVGFHQPDFPGLTAEQRSIIVRDNTALYTAAGMSGSFVSRVMATPASDMWYPSYDELVDAGVITGEEIVVGNSSKDQLGLAIANSARQVNRGAPLKLDEFTQLVGAEASGHQLIFNHKLLVDVPNNKVVGLSDKMEDNVKASACADAGAKSLVQSGGRIVYRYRSVGGRKLFDITVTSCA